MTISVAFGQLFPSYSVIILVVVIIPEPQCSRGIPGGPEIPRCRTLEPGPVPALLKTYIHIYGCCLWFTLALRKCVG